MKIRKYTLMIMMILFTLTFMFTGTKKVSAKVTFNKTSMSITKGKKYTIKISGVKNRSIKKVKLKYNKKIIKIKKIKKNTYRIIGRKKGKTILKAGIKYVLLDHTIGVRNIRCKISVKNKKIEKKANDRKEDEKESIDEIKDDVNWSENIIDKLAAQVEKSEKYKGEFYKINDYSVFEKNAFSDGSDGYGIITSPFYSTIDWYNKKDYDKIMTEVKKIVEECKITDDMIDEEKAYRIGRYIVKHIDYNYNVYGQRIYETLFDKKTVCAGYSKTYALICRYVGIDCDFVCSYDNQNKSGHAWNYVKLGDYYYITDLTGAYFTRKVYDGVSNFFREYSNIGEENIKYMDDYYKIDEYTEKHPVDEIDYYTRCKNEGKDCLKQKELYNLPE